MDFANAVKKQTKDSLAYQSVKQKLRMRSNVSDHHSLLSASTRVAGGSTMSLNSSISSSNTLTTVVSAEAISITGAEKVFHKEDKEKAELLLGMNKLMPKRGGGKK